MCERKKELSASTFSVDYCNGIIIVMNVKAEICVQCGEEWIDDKTADELEVIAGESRSKKLQLEVVAM